MVAERRHIARNQRRRAVLRASVQVLHGVRVDNAGRLAKVRAASVVPECILIVVTLGVLQSVVDLLVLGVNSRQVASPHFPIKRGLGRERHERSLKVVALHWHNAWILNNVEDLVQHGHVLRVDLSLTVRIKLLLLVVHLDVLVLARRASVNT